MSHNLVQKRGRYPKTKQENNLAQGGWQAQTLSVPSQSQGFPDGEYNYQNQNQEVDGQHTQHYTNEWSDHQRVVNEEPAQKSDPNGHNAQQDVWNDWGDQGWENWDNNNSQQSQPTQSYYGQPQHQQVNNQQPHQYQAYDQGYPNQQEQQHSSIFNHQSYGHYPQQVDQNSPTYPVSCSTPHYQYNEENSVAQYSPNNQLGGLASSNQIQDRQGYSVQVGAQPPEQIDIAGNLQNEHQQFNHDTAFQQQPQQQHNFHQQLPQSQTPPQDYNSLNYDQHRVSQHQEHQHPLHVPDFSQAYSSLEQDARVSENNQFGCSMSAITESGEHTTLQEEHHLQPVTFEASTGAGGDDSYREKDDGVVQIGNGSAYAGEGMLNSPLTPQEHKDEPISDSWDTLEDNMECLSIRDQPEESIAESREVSCAEAELSHQRLPQEPQPHVAHQMEVSQQIAQHNEGQDLHTPQNQPEQEPPQREYPGHEPQGQQVQQVPEGHIVEEEERQLEHHPTLQAQWQQRHQDEVQSQASSALPSLSEVLQAKKLKVESTGFGDSRSLEPSALDRHEEPSVLPSPKIETRTKSRTNSSGSSHSERQDLFDKGFDIGSQERTSFMADMIRPASEGAPAEVASAAPVSFPVPAASPVLRTANTFTGDTQSDMNYEPIAAREVVGQRASAERSAPAGLDLKASSVRQSPLGGEGGNLVAPAAPAKALPETPSHAANTESYRSGSQDERVRSRRSARSSSSEDSEVAEHNREILRKTLREREYELPAVSKRDAKWKNSRDRLREHDYHSDESEVRKQRRKGNRDSDGERARRKYASDRDYEDDEYYDDRRYRRRNDRKRDSDDTEYSEYASDRRQRYRSDNDTDTASRPKRRSDEVRRPRNKKYPDDSDFDSRRPGRRHTDGNRRDRRHDFYYGRPPSRDSSLNDSLATSQISDSEVSMYDNRRTRHAGFDRHPAMGVHQVHDSRNFKPQVLRSHPPQSQISAGMIPEEMRGQNLQLVRHAYETDPDYRDVLDDYFLQCATQGFDISHVRSYVCGGSNLQQSSFTAGLSDLNESLNSSMAFPESSTLNEEPAAPEELRKYTRPHAFACFSSLNSLVKFYPAQRSLDLKPPVVEIHDLKLLLEDDPESKALSKFPGPLVSPDTHKNQVIHFCNQRVNAIRKNKPYVDHIVDRESYVLLWELLILLLRQNGHVTGTDIAELLLKDAPYVDPASVQKLAEQEMSQIEESDEGNSDDSQTTVDGTRLNRAALQIRRQGLSHEQALSKFRELLLFGHRKEAIEHAIRYELWGHAFCLSSKMDGKLQTYVHSKFYQSFAGNDPLQTVYQLYSGRQPTSVTCVGDVTWGDWRPHLAMVLANPSVRPEIDAKSIVTMGDVLLSKGCLCAAHFCYLMAQVEFGEFQDKRCKLVLLGSNHMLSFAEFATNEAIECTEIYEYAQSLSNPGYTLPTLGLYKYLHAKRFIDQGFVQEGLNYCERLALDIVRNATAYKPELIHEVYCLASRLRYNDAHYSQDAVNNENLDQPPWLENLERVNIALQSGVPLDHTFGSRRSSDYDGSNIKVEPQYSDPSSQQHELQEQAIQPAQQLPEQVPQQLPPQQRFCPPQQQGHEYYSQEQQELPQHQQSSHQFYHGHPNEHPPQEEQREEESAHKMSGVDYSNEVYSQSSSVDEIHQASPAPIQPAAPEHPSPHIPPHNYAPRQSVTSISSSITSASTNDSMLRPPLAQNEMTSYQPHQTLQTPPKAEPTSPQTSPSTRKETQPTSSAGGSWLNGIFKRLNLQKKGPNQMILPDDTQKPIVWDPKTNTWVDSTAGPEAQQAAAAPPPSDRSLGATSAPPIPLMSTHQPIQQDVSSAMTVPSQAVDRVDAGPTSTANRFQRIPTRHRYVDVFNQNHQTKPAGQPVASIVPDGNVPQFMMPSAQPQLFVPSAPTGTQNEPFDLATNRVDFEEQQQSHELDKHPGT